MYYILNYFPLFLYVVMGMLHIEFGFVFDILTWGMLFVFIVPIYQLFIHSLYLRKKTVSYKKGFFNVVIANVLNILSFILINKIKTGYFIGDTPISLCFMMFGSPIIITIVGEMVLYFFELTNTKR